MKQNCYIKKIFPYPFAFPVRHSFSDGGSNCQFPEQLYRGVLLILFFTLQIHPVTFVYNLKIAVSTRLRSIPFGAKCDSLAVFTPIQQWKEKYNGTKQTAGGGMGIYIYHTKSWYFEVDWAVAKVKQGCFSRIQTDDILLTGGYTHDFSRNNRGSFLALLGVPTHKDDIFQPIEFGINHPALGAQFDDSWTYSQNGIHYLFSAFRYLHFFARTVTNFVEGQEIHFNFSRGNAIDLLIAHASNWGKHKLEFGYNPTFAFGATVCPALPALTHAAKGIRHGFYANYRYAFFINKKHLAAFILGTSYAFDSIPKDVGFKSIYTAWAALAICF